jgi:hypothetical protein
LRNQKQPGFCQALRQIILHALKAFRDLVEQPSPVPPHRLERTEAASKMKV